MRIACQVCIVPDLPVTSPTIKVRPSTTVTNRIKVLQMAAYGIADQPMAAEELDHLIPLELGGAPADAANLWPEPWTGDTNARQKDAVETHLKRQVVQRRRVACGRAADDCNGLASGLPRKQPAAGAIV